MRLFINIAFKPVLVQMIPNSATHDITLFVFLISLICIAAIGIFFITVSIKHHIRKRTIKKFNGGKG